MLQHKAYAFCSGYKLGLQALYLVKHMLNLFGACYVGDSWAEQLIAAEVSRHAG